MRLEQELLKQMSNDMGITQFQEEDETQYQTRLLYSGMSLWIKTSCNDTYQDDSLEGYEAETSRATKHAVTKKCQKIFDTYLELFPNLKTWFYPKSQNTENPIQEIRNRLIGTGNLVPSSKNTLQHPPISYLKITDALYLYRGLDPCLEQVIGIGTYTTQLPPRFSSACETVSSMFSLPSIPSDIFVQHYWRQNMKYFSESRNPPPSREYFDYKTDIPNSESWRKKQIMGEKLTVYRDAETISGLVSSKDGKEYIYRFPEWMQNSHEYRRFYYGLRHCYGYSQKVKISEKEDHFFLRLPSYLPDAEQYALYMVCWPYRNLYDKIQFIGPINVLPTIEHILCNLNLVLSYD